jgi:two-component system sensor histidine kinase PilS (NtrC family)
VIEEMQDGVLVVDRKCRVRAANPSARALLAPEGSIGPAPFELRAVAEWAALVAAVESAFVDNDWPEAGREVTLQLAPGRARTLRLRVRFPRRAEPQASEEMCVLFIEDLRSVQARIRQEKLAAMGRVSAGIAHEIRNPLAAIAQANDLLAEDATTPVQQQLTRLVTDNVERLKRIVDDVMAVAPGAPHAASVIDASEIVGQVCGEWARSARLSQGEGGAVRIDVPSAPLGVAFDAEHLRRVLVNLLDNARRHGGDAGPIAVTLTARDERHAVLIVASGAAPIAAEVERFLFEPFFSTRSRGTGLGLYICRELCERHGASVEYRQRPPGEPGRNEFVVVMRRENALDLAGHVPTLFPA